jgi:hypothetical protein
MEKDIKQGEIEEIKGKAIGLLEKATILSSSIKTPEDYKSASEFQATLKEMEKAVETKRKEITVPMDNAKKRVMDLFRPITDTIDKAKKMVDRARFSWEQEQEVARKAEEARLATKAKKEAEALQAKADKARAEGKEGKAIEYEGKAQLRGIAPTIPAVVPKVDGLSTRKTIWKAKVVDMKSLLKYCLETGSDLVIANELQLSATAKATKGTLPIPGVVFYEEKSAA